VAGRCVLSEVPQFCKPDGPAVLQEKETVGPGELFVKLLPEGAERLSTVNVGVIVSTPKVSYWNDAQLAATLEMVDAFGRKTSPSDSAQSVAKKCRL